MFKQSVGVAFLLVSLLGCGDGGAGAGSASASAKPAASGSAKPAASASAKPSAAPAPTASASAAAPAGDVTLDEFVKVSSSVLKAVADNAGDCKKMAEALKAVMPDDAKMKAMDEWEAKQKADPELKKALNAAMEKAMEPMGKEFIAGVAKCEKDPDVKALMDKMKGAEDEEKKDGDKKDEEKKEEPKK